ncbi:hypothetical protein ACFWIA_10970 [Streptomyces sp. NPDC127068]|uniref:hypothetical protein n=1 Tax=Streptomyces sp. NPDC127068 TaxID=3347127 RepID=UPI0036569564
MSYRIAYADLARAGRNALSPTVRKTFDAGVAAIARAPYGCGSSAVLGSRDRRDAAIGGIAVIRYEVSPSVVTVTVVRVTGF